MADSIPTATLAVNSKQTICGAPSGTLRDDAVAAIDGMDAHRPLRYRDVPCGSGRARASGEVLVSWETTGRRLREGVEFFRFLRKHEA